MLEFVAEQLSVPPDTWFDYDLKGRSSQRDRERIRTFLGFRQVTVSDAEQIQEWLLQEVVSLDQDTRHLRSAVADWCRGHHIERPTPERVGRMIASAIRDFDEIFFAKIGSVQDTCKF